MASVVPMARSRGSVSGLALVLLGAWGGLMLFIGPYFHFGYTPDKTWVYDTGRLYAAIVPGGVALLAGLVVLATRSRWFAATCASLAVLAGVWFVIGREVLTVVVSNPGAYQIGAPIEPSFSLHRIVATNLATFTGVGLLIVLFAALALGRVSIGAHKDVLRFGDAAAGSAASVGGLASVGLGPTSPSYGSASPSYGSASPSYAPYQSPTVSTFIPEEDPVVGGQAKFPSQYPSAGEETVAQPGANTNTFTPGQITYSPGQTRYPPVTEQQTNPLTAPTQEQKFQPGQ